MIRRHMFTAAAVLGLTGALLLCILALKPVVPAFAYSVLSAGEFDEDVGVVILAPNGSADLAKPVKVMVRELESRFPIEIAFGGTEPVAVHVAVEKLKVRGAERIIMVPLLTSSHSMLMKQTRYILGLGEPPAALGYVAHPVPIDVPFVLGDGMDSSPVIAEALADRAKEKSRNPAKETLVILSEGTPNEQDDALCLRDMAKLAETIRLQIRFKRVVPFTLHDDSDVYTQSDDVLRKLVKDESSKGQVIVVQLALLDGDLKDRTAERLQGLNYTYNAKGLLSHPKLVQWIKNSIDKQLLKLNWERLAGDSMVITT